MHGEQPGGMVYRKPPIGPGFHMKMSGPTGFFVEEVNG
jgi:hypothetical protein